MADKSDDGYGTGYDKLEDEDEFNRKSPSITKREEVLSPKQRSRRLYISVAMILTSAFFFTLMSVSIVEASKAFGAFQIVFARQFHGMVLCMIYLLYSREPLLGPPGFYLLQTFNGLILTGATFAYMVSVTVIPIADAISLTYTGPMWISICCIVFLRERLTIAGAVTIVCCLVGVVLIARPTFLGFPDESDDESSGDKDDGEVSAGERSVYIIICLVGAVLWGPNALIVRKMSGQGIQCDPFVFVFYLCATSSVIAAIVSGAAETKHWQSTDANGLQWAALLGTGLFGFIGQALVHGAVKLVPEGYVSLISNMRYSELVLSVIASVLVGDSVHDLSFVGAVFICVPTMYQFASSLVASKSTPASSSHSAASSDAANAEINKT